MFIYTVCICLYMIVLLINCLVALSATQMSRGIFMPLVMPTVMPTVMPIATPIRCDLKLLVLVSVDIFYICMRITFAAH